MRNHWWNVTVADLIEGGCTKGETMRRTTATLGAALVLGSAALVATPASAQPHVDCAEPLRPPCAVVNFVLAGLPGTVERVRGIVLPVYDQVTGTVRCVISGDCP